MLLPHVFPVGRLGVIVPPTMTRRNQTVKWLASNWVMHEATVDTQSH